MNGSRTELEKKLNFYYLCFMQTLDKTNLSGINVLSKNKIAKNIKKAVGTSDVGEVISSIDIVQQEIKKINIKLKKDIKIDYEKITGYYSLEYEEKSGLESGLCDKKLIFLANKIRDTKRDLIILHSEKKPVKNSNNYDYHNKTKASNVIEIKEYPKWDEKYFYGEESDREMLRILMKIFDEIIDDYLKHEFIFSRNKNKLVELKNKYHDWVENGIPDFGQNYKKMHEYFFGIEVELVNLHPEKEFKCFLSDDLIKNINENKKIQPRDKMKLLEHYNGTENSSNAIYDLIFETNSLLHEIGKLNKDDISIVVKEEKDKEKEGEFVQSIVAEEDNKDKKKKNSYDDIVVSADKDYLIKKLDEAIEKYISFLEECRINEFEEKEKEFRDAVWASKTSRGKLAPLTEKEIETNNSNIDKINKKIEELWNYSVHQENGEEMNDEELEELLSLLKEAKDNIVRAKVKKELSDTGFSNRKNELELKTIQDRVNDKYKLLEFKVKNHLRNVIFIEIEKGQINNDEELFSRLDELYLVAPRAENKGRRL